jgi:hypothetical protein
MSLLILVHKEIKMKMKAHRVPSSMITIYVIVAVKASNSPRDVGIIALDVVLLFVISMERPRIPILSHVKFLVIAFAIDA